MVKIFSFSLFLFQHACVAPAFDPDNPFLLATLLPLTQEGGVSSEERVDHTFEPSENLGESGGDPFVLMPESERVVDVSTARAQVLNHHHHRGIFLLFAMGTPE